MAADPLDLLGAGLDVTQPVAGADLLGKGPEQTGPGAKGWRAGVAGIKSGAAGVARAVGDAAGIQPLADFGARVAAEQDAVAAENSMRVEDVKDFGGAVDFAKYGLATAAPSLLTFLAGTLLGRGVGGALAKRAVETSTKEMLKTAGMVAGGSATSFGLEGGGSYNENLEEGVKNPLARAVGVGAANAALDTLFPVLVAKRLRLLGAGEQATRKAGFGAIAKGVGGAIATDVPIEAGTEGLQEAITALGAGKDLTDPAVRSAILNSAVVGGLAGGAVGGVSGGVSKALTPVEQAPAPVVAPVEQPAPLPNILGDTALNTQISDTSLFSSLAEAQAGEPPRPLSTTGPQLSPTEPESRYNRPAALVAEDADITRRDALVAERDAARSKAAEIGQQLINETKKRERVLLQRQLDEVSATLPALDTQIGDLNTQIGVRSRINVLPEVSPAAERTGSTEGTVLGETPLPDTTEAERMIAETKRSLGLLVSSREAKLAPLQDVGTSSQVQTVPHSGTQPRSSERVPDQKTLTGAMIEAGRAVAAKDVPALVKTKGDSSLKAPTPEQNTARERAIRDAVDSVITEAAAQPSVEKAQAHIMAELPKAVKGKLDATTAGELADRVARGLGQAPRYYSKGAISNPSLREGARERLLGKIPKAAMDKVLAWGRAGGRLNYHDISELVSGIPLTDQQRTALRATYDAKSAERYEARIATALEQGDAERAQRWAERYDRALIASGLSAEVPNAARAYGTRHPSATSLMGALSSLKDLARRIRENSEEEQDRAHLSVVPDSPEQKSNDATNASQDVYDRVMERRGQDAVRQFQFIYGEHGEQFDIYKAGAEQPAAGYYQAMQEMKDIIGFAFNAQNLPSVADHEAFHALETRKLDHRERVILSRAFRPGQPLFEKVLASAQRYDNEHQTHTADEILTIPAEARAYGFQHWRAGNLEVEGPIATIFAKIKEFLSRVANSMRGLGFQSVEDIYRAIAKGEFAARQRREGGTILRYADRDPSDPRFAPDLPSFQNLAALKYPQLELRFKELSNGDVTFGFRHYSETTKGTRIAAKFMDDFTAWLDLEQRGSPILAMSEDEAQFPLTDLVAMYRKRGWVPLTPREGDFDPAVARKMYREPRSMNDVGIFGQADGVVGEGRRGDRQNALGGEQRWYYSALTNAVSDDKSPKSASAQGWRDFLRGLKQKGVKPAEIEASGLEQWLDLQSGRVTREAVVDYLSTNGVKVEEVLLGDLTKTKYEPVLQEWEALVGELEGLGYSLSMEPDTNTDSLVIASLEKRERLPDGSTAVTSWGFDPADGFELTANTDTFGATRRPQTQTTLPPRMLEIGRRFAELEPLLPEPNGEAEGDTKFSQYQLPGGTNYRELLLTLPGAKPHPKLARFQELSRVRVMTREQEAEYNMLGREIYPNGLPRPQEDVRTAESTGFRSSHFDQPNILAHVRFNERTDAGGQRVLFIEEIQSDWAQKGKKEGFGDTGYAAKIKEAEAAERAGRELEYAAAREGRELTPAESLHYLARQREASNLRAAASKLAVRGVPQAPFVGKTDAWVALAMKRMISYAAEHGYDKVAWTNGEQQVSRYRQALQKHVDRIEWEKTKDGVHITGYKGGAVQKGVNPAITTAALEAIARNDNLGFDTEREALDAVYESREDWGNRWEVPGIADQDAIQNFVEEKARVGRRSRQQTVVDTRYAENELSDAIGKAMADKIKADPAAKGVIEGADITVSDTGMAGFYDRIVPAVANEILRKLGGGKVGEVSVDLSTQNSTYKDYIVAPGRTNEFAVFGVPRDGGEPVIVNQNARNEADARALADEYRATVVPNANKQQGFSLTPQMRQAVMAGGLPLFNKGAIEPDVPQQPFMTLAGRDMDRYFADAQLPRDQKYRAAAQLFDPENLPDATAKQMFGATAAEMGKLQEFWHKHFASGTFLSRYSKGYENVQRVLSAFKQRQSQLFSHAVNVQMSDWLTATDADLEATSKAIFKATVGNIQKGSAEFQLLYGALTAKQQTMVRQVFGDAKQQGMIADLLWKEFEADARDLQKELPAAEFAQWQANRRTRIERLIKDSYVPERRYGDYTVKITKKIPSSEPGKPAESLVLFYDQFENRGIAQLEASRYEALLRAKGVEGLDVEFGTRHAADRDTSLSLRQFFSAARRHGVELTAAERQRVARALVEADSTRMNRIMQRKNVPGYSQDGRRVLTEFALAMSSKIAHSEFTDPIEASLQGRAVDTQMVDGRPVSTVSPARALWAADGPHSGFYRNLADRLADFVLSPPTEGKWARQLKSAGTLYFLGGNLSFGLVNLSSLPLNTVPFLTTVAPYTQAFSTVLSSFRTVAKNQAILRDVSRLSNRDIKIEGISDELRSALIQAAEDGTTLDTQIHHLMGLTEGQQFTNSRKVQRAMDAWMWPFRTSEQINRITTFMSAYKIAETLPGAQGQMTAKEKYEFARRAVAVTQGRYDQANAPGFAQSPLWSTLFMFKSFPIFMIEMLITLHKERPAAAVAMMLSLTAAAGVTGLPFAEDLMDIIDVVSQRLFGSTFNSKRAVRNVVKSASEAMVGADLSGLFLNGAINDWLGVNLSTRVGLGNLIPATRLGAADNDYKRTLEEVLGPTGGMLTAAATGLDHLTKGEFMDALKAGSPVSVRNAFKGAQQVASGEAVDTQGRKLRDVNGWEAFWQTLGFTSAGLNSMYSLDRLDKQDQAYYNQVRDDFGKDFVRAVREGNAERAQDIMEAIQAWNERNPEMPISFAPALMRRQIALSGMPLNARTLRMLPRQLRGTSISMEGMQE